MKHFDILQFFSYTLAMNLTQTQHGISLLYPLRHEKVKLKKDLLNTSFNKITKIVNVEKTALHILKLDLHEY